MRTYHTAAHLHTRYRRDELADLLAEYLPRLHDWLEVAAMYSLVALLWGLIVYAAVAFALP